MKKQLLKLTIILLVIVFIQWLFLSDRQINTSSFEDIITFLSILFGFYITSLAIFVTSTYVSDLYKMVDSENKSVTLLHTLTDNYKFGLFLALGSLIYYISVHLMVGSEGDLSHALYYGELIALPFTGLLLMNFYYCASLVNNLVNIIIQEGKKKK